MFDLGADPNAIATFLSGDPLLRDLLKAHPGIRMPGTWDGFELAVRAILGQQISVSAATTIAGRVTTMCGSAVSEGGELSRLFPTAIQLANAPIERAGVIAARAGAIRGLARRVAEKAISFGPFVNQHEMVTALRSLPGIGDWTVSYIAMRAFGEPDAFPSGDLVLRRMAGVVSPRDLDARAEAWRPWRAYAVMLLWQGATDRSNQSKPRLSDGGRFNVPVTPEAVDGGRRVRG